LQGKLRQRVLDKDDFGEIRRVAGVDVAFSQDKKTAIAGVVVFAFPSLGEMERVWAQVPLRFPYIPGLLSFREGPAIIQAFKKLKTPPDVVLFDGQGFAHPRRIGIASHMGLVLGIPSIGCAKSRLCGTFREPGRKRGSWSPLHDRGELIGAVLRTRDGVKPIFVSVGHRVALSSAIRMVLECHDGTRIPKPTREADHFVSRLKRESGH
jgi:deoxyribonuclease V